MHLDSYSSNLFEFYVPHDCAEGFTRSVTFSIQSEDEYTPIEMYFSLDDFIYLVEERNVENIMSNGVGYYFTSDDFGWCTGCFIYFFVDITVPGRYYVQGVSSARNSIIAKDKVYDKFVNTRQQDCFQYYVQDASTDVLITASQYQGDVELYIAGGTIPSGPNDAAIALKSDRAPHRTMILSASDRLRFGVKTGLYEVCMFGYDYSGV